MIAVTFPPYEPRTRQQDGKTRVFDPIRRQWVILTPEEWVRQHMLHYFVETLQYPPSLMAVEKEIRLGELKKRCDILIYNRDGKPFLLVECKEMTISVTDAVLQQVLRYNQALQVPYLALTNGRYTWLFHNTGGQLVEAGEWPLI